MSVDAQHNLLVGLIALAAAVLFASSNVLEQRSARRAPPEKALHLSLIADLARRGPWIVGTVLDVLGYATQAVALGLGRILFVQPIIATSLLFTLGLDVATSERSLRRSEWVSAVLLASALGVFLVVAQPSGGAARAPFARWAVPFAVVGAVVLVLTAFARRSTGSVRASTLAFGAGMLAGVSSPLTKSFAHLVARGPRAVFTNWEPYALAIVAPTGFVLTQSAFQAGDLAAAAPFLETVEPIVASILGVVLLGEHLHVTTTLEKIVVATSIAVMIVSAVYLAREQGRRDERAARQANRRA